MKRIQYHQYGGPDVMRLEDFEPARPGTGEVLVRVRAAAANPMDWGIRGGAMKMVTGRKFPRGLGYDFAGVVEAVGDGVTRLAVGDEVLGGASVKASGAFAEMVLAAEKGVVKKPENLSFEEAAAIPTVDLTAFQADAAKRMLTPGGRIVSIHPTPANIAKSALPGPYNVLITRPVTADLEEVAHAAGGGILRVPVARTVPLADAIAALTELERNGTPKGGKLVITTV